MASDSRELVEQLTSELANFEDIARYLSPQPGELPRVRGIDVFGGTRALNGVVGGDHLIYVDFKQRFDLDARIRQAIADDKPDVVDNLKRCQKMAGIAVLDVSGHQVTDAFMAAMLHQAFLLGSIYELDMFGQITRRLLENLNTRFYQSSAAYKFVSMIYGEISEDFRFRFISAAQPFPAVFSVEHDRFMEVGKELRIVFPPLGMQPSLDVIDRDRTKSPLGFKDTYETNDWLLMGQGDILLLHTDGLSEHTRGDEPYFPRHLEEVVRRVKDRPAADIYAAIQADLVAFSKPADDVTIVVIKRT
jgi:serine phosphatase RsbU (regulator of sigma subunit)